MSVVDSGELAEAIKEALTEYIGVTEEAVRKGVAETSKKALSELQNAHPSGSGKYGSWDDYNQGWTIMQTKNDKRRHISATIHNKDHYQLTHLLEKGHALRGGGRAQAFEHIGPVAEWVDENLTNIIKSNIEKEN